MSVLLISSLNLFCFSVLWVAVFLLVVFHLFDFWWLTLPWFPWVGADIAAPRWPFTLPKLLLPQSLRGLASSPILLCCFHSCWVRCPDIYFLWSMHYLERCHPVSGSWGFSPFFSVLISILNILWLQSKSM